MADVVPDDDQSNVPSLIDKLRDRWTQFVSSGLTDAWSADTPKEDSPGREQRNRPLSMFISHVRDICVKRNLEPESTPADDPGTPSGPLPGLLPVMRVVQERRKYIIIMVGLPGRGKTYLCNKVMCYLNWLGHTSRHFNVGSYRRQLGKQGLVSQDSTYFDSGNSEGTRERQEALQLALEALLQWIQEDYAQVAILDATNSTWERRDYLIQHFHNKYQYLFIESICNDEETLAKNIKQKLLYSPDYHGMDPETAARDFKNRIQKYEEVYEPLTDGKSNRHVHFIQLNNMVTGRGHIDINRISGYLPGKLVFFLMQVCRSGLHFNRRIWLTRHGESEYNRMGKIGGDSDLTERGRKYGAALARALVQLVPVPEDSGPFAVSCWTSTLKRTIQTARDVPFPKLQWKALDEIQAGICDGHTYEEIYNKWPKTFQARKEDKLNFRYPAGESYMDVVKRLESVIIEIERETESVCIVAHQAILRILYGYFMRTELKQIPKLDMPLHTLIELVPRPDGTLNERRYAINIDAKGDNDLLTPLREVAAAPASPGSKPHVDSSRWRATETATETAEVASARSRPKSSLHYQPYSAVSNEDGAAGSGGSRGFNNLLRSSCATRLHQSGEVQGTVSRNTSFRTTVEEDGDVGEYGDGGLASHGLEDSGQQSANTERSGV